MKKIKKSSDVTLISFYKSILDDNGIESIIKNYYLTGGVGDIPPQDAIPELWILDDDKVEQAKALLTEVHSTPWICKCGEKLAGNFVQCWKCGKMRES